MMITFVARFWLSNNRINYECSNDSINHFDCPAHWIVARVAVQRGMGLLSQRWSRSGSFDFGHSATPWKIMRALVIKSTKPCVVAAGHSRFFFLSLWRQASRQTAKNWVVDLRNANHWINHFYSFTHNHCGKAWKYALAFLGTTIAVGNLSYRSHDEAD